MGIDTYIHSTTVLCDSTCYSIVTQISDTVFSVESCLM